jgi:hypothetical protein
MLRRGFRAARFRRRGSPATGIFPSAQRISSLVLYQPASPWNYENLQRSQQAGLQYLVSNYLNYEVGPVTNWTLFLNQYFWLQNFVDQQVGLVLDALASSAFANNTIIVFLSDHGEYADLTACTKGSAAYDESIRVPFYVQFPGQSGSISMNQMCSGVDCFGLMCDLATGGSGQWRLAYPDLANRQSIWSFLYNNSAETRVAPAPIGIPYIFHTFDAGQHLNSRKEPHCVHAHETECECGTDRRQAGVLLRVGALHHLSGLDAAGPGVLRLQSANHQQHHGDGQRLFQQQSTTQNTIAQYTQAMGSLGRLRRG